MRGFWSCTKIPVMAAGTPESQDSAWSVVLTDQQSGNGKSGPVWTHQKFSDVESLCSFLAAAAKTGTAVVPGLPGPIPPHAKLDALAYLDISGLDQVLEPPSGDLVLSVQTGMTMGNLQKLLAHHKQWWPLDAAAPDATISDIINNGEGGCLEHQYGGPRDTVLGLSVALADGTTINTGGRVVKNVSGYDLTRLFVGAHGSLGIIYQAFLRLQAQPELALTMLLSMSGVEEALDAWSAVCQSGLPAACLELVDVQLASKIAAGDKDLQDLAEFAANGKPTDWLLCLRVVGMAETVRETLVQIKTMLASSRTLELAEAASQRWWQALADSQLFCQLPKLELCASPSTIRNLLVTAGVSATGGLAQARPSRGRLKILGETACLEAIASTLTRLCQSSGKPVIASQATATANLAVRRLGTEDIVNQALKRRLKDRFDPKGILNPLVEL